MDLRASERMASFNNIDALCLKQFHIQQYGDWYTGR